MAKPENLALGKVKARIRGSKFKLCKLSLYYELDDVLLSFNVPFYPLPPRRVVVAWFKAKFGDELYWYQFSSTESLRKPISEKITSSRNLGSIKYFDEELDVEDEDTLEQYLDAYFSLVEVAITSFQTNQSKIVHDRMNAIDEETSTLPYGEALLVYLISKGQLSSAIDLSKSVANESLQFRVNHGIPNYVHPNQTFTEFISEHSQESLKEYVEKVRSVSRFGEYAAA